MNPRPLSLFALEGSREYGERVANELDVALAPHEERAFEDGEHKTRPLQDVRGHDVFVIHALHGDLRHSANDKLCRLLFFCGALRDSGAARVSIVAPYLCYARKDRRTKTNDPVITRYVAEMIEALGVGAVITLEVHNLAAFENAFRCPTRHIESAPLFAAHFARLLGDAPCVVVSPDAGGAKRAEQLREQLEALTGRDVGSAYMEKFRSSGVVSGGLLAGDVRGKAAVIVDDLISTGTTLVRAAAACQAGGADRVFAAAAHGLFMDGAPALFAAAGLERIVTLDTVPPFRLTPDRVAGRLTILSSAPSVARVIAECHDAA